MPAEVETTVSDIKRARKELNEMSLNLRAYWMQRLKDKKIDENGDQEKTRRYIITAPLHCSGQTLSLPH
jgi:hypothetical protein